MIIDVRTPGEYKVGHIEESYNFPLNTLLQNSRILKSFNKPLVLVCKSGNRSKEAQNILSEKGIESYNSGAWNILESKLHGSV